MPYMVVIPYSNRQVKLKMGVKIYCRGLYN
nr:MAG TPA: hypothetical protein [Caudoviricetes sp.]